RCSGDPSSSCISPTSTSARRITTSLSSLRSQPQLSLALAGVDMLSRWVPCWIFLRTGRRTKRWSDTRGARPDPLAPPDIDAAGNQQHRSDYHAWPQGVAKPREAINGGKQHLRVEIGRQH